MSSLPLSGPPGRRASGDGERPHVTVVIPTRDRWDWLADALGAALGQRGVEVEVVVIDDASRTEGREVPGRSDPRVRWLRLDENVGVAEARNRGAAEGDAPWIAFLDDDDLWAPEHLVELVRACDAHDADFGWSASWIADERRGVRAFRPAPPAERLSDQLILENAIGTPSGVIVRRRFWHAVGGFDTQLSAMADWDLWLRFSAAGTGATSGMPTTAYTEHGDAMSLQMAAVLREFRELRRRYDAMAHQRRLVFGGDGFPLWLAHGYRRNGQRARSALWYLRSAIAARRPSDGLRALGMLGGEPVMNLMGTRAKPTTLPPPRWLEASAARREG
jgi:GT2 family glycosyltransferase